MKKYKIEKIEGGYHKTLKTDGSFDFYNPNVRYFDTKKDAIIWIAEHSYRGMSWKYEAIECEV